MTVYRCLNCQTKVVAAKLPKQCGWCRAGSMWLKDEAQVSLNGIENERERVAALAESEGERLTEVLRTPKADVSAMSGRIERDSPLFFGAGDNPTLF